MSAPIDVLAVLDGYIGKVEEEWYETATDLREARAAMAELIDKATAVVESSGDSLPALRALDAALASIGGAP